MPYRRFHKFQNAPSKRKKDGHLKKCEARSRFKEDMVLDGSGDGGGGGDDDDDDDNREGGEEEIWCWMVGCSIGIKLCTMAPEPSSSTRPSTFPDSVR